ncbi:hypothetical protein [Sedimentitalea nanhaiensis]|uniref:DUF3302 domain-containing protein n=1 Tax=Sedimentitalea nanhaiensis TaxID=999627 RepID=A0A1I7E6P0_9RHOB|nr:hypothetical protein [Sedimentitalea nanhaiensis]SFU19575.1 hypothetical protein SAMN05216236_1474 [Sedimentitalea nanhaiensis]
MENAESGWSAIQNYYYFWDFVALACGMICVFGGLAAIAWLLGLPGRIAIARNHPEAEAVYTMGWTGFLAVVPWIQAFTWAFKPTDVIDIRRFPDEEREAIKEDLARLKKYAYGKVDEPEPGQPIPKEPEI